MMEAHESSGAERGYARANERSEVSAGLVRDMHTKMQWSEQLRGAGGSETWSRPSGRAERVQAGLKI